MTGQTLATPWCKGGWPRSHDHANLGGLGGLGSPPKLCSHCSVSPAYPWPCAGEEEVAASQKAGVDSEDRKSVV